MILTHEAESKVKCAGDIAGITISQQSISNSEVSC